MSYYISPHFQDKVSIHITKNYLDLPGVRVPLILGIHGRKGEGKSFQCDLVFEKMGIEPVYMSAGELESPDAGDPGRLIRLRYREAAEFIKVRGKMCVLMINDLDAGAGRFDQGTQYTVNTQLVNGTLMNIADKPTDVQLPGSYDSTPLHRVPIIITGNDLSTLYAPLIRDGRMDKFYWEPSHDDKIGIVAGIFSEDKLPLANIEQLVNSFPNQSIDFFGALRSRIYDEQVRQFIHEVGIEKVSARVVNSIEGAPKFKKPDFQLSHLIKVGNLMVQEQKRVQNMGLVKEYNQSLRYAAQVPISDTEDTFKSTASAIKIENNQISKTQLDAEILTHLQQLLSADYRIGIEYVDQRRFKTNSWQSCATISSNQQPEVIAAVESCLDAHNKDYVRLFGIDTKAKKRVMEKIIHRPNC